jgi:hypothetical protein
MKPLLFISAIVSFLLALSKVSTVPVHHNPAEVGMWFITALFCFILGCICPGINIPD